MLNYTPLTEHKHPVKESDTCNKITVQCATLSNPGEIILIDDIAETQLGNWIFLLNPW